MGLSTVSVALLRPERRVGGLMVCRFLRLVSLTCVCVCVCAQARQACLVLCDPVDCSQTMAV